MPTSASYSWSKSTQTGLKPNETRSIAFKPYPEDLEYNSTKWTWRVNITDIPVPDKETDFPVGKPSSKSPDTRALRITYDLSWPGGRSLRDTIANDSPRLCVSFPYTIGSMPNVTNNWPEANTDSPDCGPVLGQACVDAILKTSSEPDANFCNGGRAWSELPECQSSFGYHYHHRDSPFGWYNTLDMGIDPEVTSGERFNWIGYTYDRASYNQSLYESAVNMLQIVLFQSEAPRSGGLNQTVMKESRPVLACMRVRTDKLSEEQYQQIADGQDEDSGSTRSTNGPVMLGALGFAVFIRWIL
ncbi:hypothetical protein V8F20_010893 [Naviculisporaceae sp. PSN 640]